MGYNVTIDELNKRTVEIFLYKGKMSAIDSVTLERTIMLRVKIKFKGDLAKFVPIDASAAKETVETIDIDLGLLEIFFKRKEKSQKVQHMFSPIVDKHMGAKIGEHVGTIAVNYRVFTELVTFLEYLAYQPFKDQQVL